MDKFREYVTGAAFCLKLTKSQIWCLAHIDYGSYYSREALEIAAIPGNDVFVPAVKSLIEKGLVLHNPEWHKNKKPAYSLTPAGKHTIKLLKLAQLIYPPKETK